MITEVEITYPSPTINLGGSNDPKEARMRFSVDIDSDTICYKSIKITGIRTTQWGLDDLEFIEKCISEVKWLHGKTLKDVVSRVV